jgi:hypothetical protein
MKAVFFLGCELLQLLHVGPALNAGLSNLHTSAAIMFFF